MRYDIREILSKIIDKIHRNETKKREDEAYETGS